ncbi:MAG: ABC transporter substrate-binding protein, partial [Acidobacteria bacterium]|nr:ABC transporter substrate-binding protein [Acidobacteriota bacterium]
MRRLLVPLVLLATVGLVAASCGGDDSSSTSTTAAGGDAKGTVTIGALLDLTGDGASLGQGSKAALEAAVTQAGANGVEVTLDVRDTGGDPATALKEIQSLQEAGVTTVIGPQTSSEAKEVLSFADEQGMLV